MSLEEPLDRAWQDAFAELGDGAAPRDDCPEPDRIWAVATGEAPVEERQAIVEHLATCPSCAAAFRLARGLSSDESVPAGSAGEGEGRGPRPASGTVVPFSTFTARGAKAREIGTTPRKERGGWLRWGASIAAVFALAAVLVPRSLWNGSSPYRGAPKSEIRSLLPEGEVLNRNAIELRWTPGPPGSRYALNVLTQEGREIVSEPELTTPRFRIPDSVVASLPPESYLYWQVERIDANGTRHLSKTFTARLP